MKEIEARILAVNPHRMRERLKAVDATLTQPLHKQTRYVFDIEKGDMSRWIRLRTTSRGTTLTVKKILSDAIDGTLEYETQVDSEAEVLDMLKIMGFEPKSYQENYRESYRLGDSEITLDYWPRLKPYMEIEAVSQEAVHDIARKLGFGPEQLISINNIKIYANEGIDLNTIDRLVFEPGTEPLA